MPDLYYRPAMALGVAAPDFPSMFSVGFHGLGLSEIEARCVTAPQFKLSATRPAIMAGLKTFVQTLVDAGVTGELWIDGSFITEKIDPKDVDLLLRCPGALLDSGTDEQKAAVRWVIANQKDSLRCDSYVVFEYPKGHALHAEGEWNLAWWLRQYGFARGPGGDPKGIVVLQLTGETS